MIKLGKDMTYPCLHYKILDRTFPAYRKDCRHFCRYDALTTTLTSVLRLVPYLPFRRSDKASSNSGVPYRITSSVTQDTKTFSEMSMTPLSGIMC